MKAGLLESLKNAEHFKIKKNWWQRESKDNLIDYHKYVFSKLEMARYILEGIGLTFGISYLFYKNFYVSIFISPLVFIFVKRKQSQLCEKRKKNLQLQFREMCISVSSGLASGSSLVNAVRQSYDEMCQMYGEDEYITIEMKYICSQININIPIEEVYARFAVRSEIEEILTFSEILNIAQRGGGDLIGIMKKTADSIGEKVEVEREIQSIVNSKRFEQMIMNVVPLFIILYMNITSPDVIEVMYRTIIGKIIMSVCLIVYVAAFLVGEKMIKIEV